MTDGLPEVEKLWMVPLGSGTICVWRETGLNITDLKLSSIRPVVRVLARQRLFLGRRVVHLLVLHAPGLIDGTDYAVELTDRSGQVSSSKLCLTLASRTTPWLGRVLRNVLAKLPIQVDRQGTGALERFLSLRSSWKAPLSHRARIGSMTLAVIDLDISADSTELPGFVFDGRSVADRSTKLVALGTRSVLIEGLPSTRKYYLESGRDLLEVDLGDEVCGDFTDFFRSLSSDAQTELIDRVVAAAGPDARPMLDTFFGRMLPRQGALDLDVSSVEILGSVQFPQELIVFASLPERPDCWRGLNMSGIKGQTKGEIEGAAVRLFDRPGGTRVTAIYAWPTTADNSPKACRFHSSGDERKAIWLQNQELSDPATRALIRALFPIDHAEPSLLTRVHVPIARAQSSCVPTPLSVVELSPPAPAPSGPVVAIVDGGDEGDLTASLLSMAYSMADSSPEIVLLMSASGVSSEHLLDRLSAATACFRTLIRAIRYDSGRPLARTVASLETGGRSIILMKSGLFPATPLWWQQCGQARALRSKMLIDAEGEFVADVLHSPSGAIWTLPELQRRGTIQALMLSNGEMLRSLDPSLTSFEGISLALTICAAQASGMAVSNAFKFIQVRKSQPGRAVVGQIDLDRALLLASQAVGNGVANDELPKVTRLGRRR